MNLRVIATPQEFRDRAGAGGLHQQPREYASGRQAGERGEQKAELHGGWPWRLYREKPRPDRKPERGPHDRGAIRRT